MSDLFDQEEIKETPQQEKVEDKQQIDMFNVEELDGWKEQWQDMPEFKAEDLTPFQSILIHFKNKEDIEKFSQLIDQKITYKTKYAWYPKTNIIHGANQRYIDES